MGPVNWLAVVLAMAVATGLAFISYGPLSRRQQTPRERVFGLLATAAQFFLPAALLGHMFARTGPAVLAAKPWLYFMMSSGAALAFVVPVLCFTYARRRLPGGVALADSLFAFSAFLAMGTVFWLMG